METLGHLDKKITFVKELFNSCVTPEDRYKKILELASSLPEYDPAKKLSCNLVEGCQSLMYVHIFFQNGCLHFTAFSEALISKGLAALLYLVYNGQPAEVVLKYPPLFLKDLQILPSLSPSRANGVASLFSKLQKASLKFLSTQNLSSSID
jgi:cysteine desulfuration protein SufE